jgi:hypothetical protein
MRMAFSLALGCAMLTKMAGSETEFHAGPAIAYAHQDSDHVTVGAKAYDNEDLTAEAFGKKADLLRYGVLPVLVVVENKRDKPLDVRHVEVNLVAADGRHSQSINPDDIPYLGHTAKRPVSMPHPPIPLPKKKNPLSAPEISERAFAAKLIAPGDSASGFFYFEATPEAGDKIYLNGLRDARSGEELLYFEFPLAK